MSPKFGHPVPPKAPRMTFGGPAREFEELPDFAESLIHSNSPQPRRNQETPPPLSEDRGGELSSDHRPSFWN